MTADVGYATHNEKTSHHEDSEPELADADGRRRSVAMNIVHNPLQVSTFRYGQGSAEHWH